jgi:biotin carboxylase
MGLRPVLLTAHSDDRVLPDDIHKLAAHVIIANTARDADAIAAVQAFHHRMPLAAVVPGFEYFVPLAARIAAALGLPGLPPDKVENVRYKHLMRQVVAAAGLRSPRFASVDSVEAGLQAAAGVGFPMVVKPVGWSGSLFVSRVNDLDTLRACLHDIFTTPFSEYGIAPPREAIIEEYVTGKEFSVEGYVFRGRTEVVSVTEKFLGQEPHFVEVGHITPTPMEEARRARIESYVVAVAAALEISIGPFHCEIRDGDQGPVLIEIGARLAGDHICDLILYSTGVDLCKITIASFMDEPQLVSRYAHRLHQSFSGIRYFIRQEITSYQQSVGFHELTELQGFTESAIQILPGDPVPPGNNSLGRLGYVICTQPTYTGLRFTLDEADNMVQFVPDERAQPTGTSQTRTIQ